MCTVSPYNYAYLKPKYILEAWAAFFNSDLKKKKSGYNGQYDVL